MGRDQSNDLTDFNTELLHTQVYAQVLTLVFVSMCRINSSFSSSFTFFISTVFLYIYFTSAHYVMAHAQLLIQVFITFFYSFLNH